MTTRQWPSHLAAADLLERAAKLAHAGKTYTAYIVIRAMYFDNAEDSEVQYRKALHELGVADIDAAVARIWEEAEGG